MNIHVSDRQFRAVSYLPHGQRFEGWLPRGDYRIGDEVTISGNWSDPPDTQLEATELYGALPVGCRWYVCTSLLTTHLTANPGV